MAGVLNNLSDYNIVLASNSPRRRQLLEELGLTFSTRVLKGIDESYPSGLDAEDIAVYISKKKADAYRETIADNELVITADTVVVCGCTALGKPHDADEACRMLRELSGKVHKVVTGVTITTKTQVKSFKSVTDVEFAELTEDEIRYYVDVYKPLDKAGAYGIQEWIGYVGVKSINGSFYNVMGLPVQKLYRELSAIK